MIGYINNALRKIERGRCAPTEGWELVPVVRTAWLQMNNGAASVLEWKHKGDWFTFWQVWTRGRPYGGDKPTKWRWTCYSCWRGAYRIGRNYPCPKGARLRIPAPPITCEPPPKRQPNADRWELLVNELAIDDLPAVEQQPTGLCSARFSALEFT